MVDIEWFQFPVFEYIPEAVIVILVGMRDNHVIKIDRCTRALITLFYPVDADHFQTPEIVAPVEKAEHIVAFTGIDQDYLVPGRDNMATITLPDIKKIYLKQTLFAE